ncbi:MAG: hypothetical protein QXS48_03360 [Candidatus Aenigmatarchaeota archaeon]
MRKYKVAIVALLLFLVLSLTVSCEATLLTPPQNVQLQGGDEDSSGNWRGGYWVFTAAVDQMDNFEGRIKLPANTTQPLKDEEGAKIKTKKTVEIVIKPVKSYFKRLLKLAPIEDRIVAPKVYRGCASKLIGNVWYEKDVSIPATVVKYYQWGEPSWEKYTIFEVSVYLEGTLMGKASLNTEAGEKEFVVNTPKGPVLIKNLGRLEGDFSEPHVPEIVLFNENYIFTSEALQYIRYDHGATTVYYPSKSCVLCYIKDSKAYSTFWFGVVRWNPCAVSDKDVAGSPAPFKQPDLAYPIIDSEKGWVARDGFWDINFIRDPIAPPIYPSEGDYSLMWYLNKMTSQGNIAKTWLRGYKWQIEMKDGEPHAVIVEIPWGAYSGAPIVTFFVPTELAETWVYRPPIADIRIESVKWVGSSEIEAAGKRKCEVVLKQYAKTASSAIVIADTSTSRASIKPTSVTITLKPNETEKLSFEVENLGVASETEGKVFFYVKRSWDGLVTSNAYLSFKLLPPVLPDNNTEIVDRTPPNPKPDPDPDSDPDKPISEHGISPWVWVLATVCITSMIVTVGAIARDEYKRKKAKELAKTAAKEGKKIVKEVTIPVWQRFKFPISIILCGIVAFFLGLFFLKYLIFAKLSIGIIDWKIGSWTLLSVPALDMAIGYICCIVGIIFVLIGIGSLIKAIVKPVSQTLPAKLIAKQLTEFLEKRDKEEEEKE